MNSTKVSIIAAAAIAGLAMLLIMGQWNNPQSPMSDGSLVQTPEASPVADSTEPTSSANDIVSETNTAPAVEQTSSSQPIVEQPVTETVNSGVSSASDASTAIVNTENIVEQSTPSSVTYVTSSGGGGHGSSHSSSHNSQGGSSQSSSDNVNTSTDGTGQGTSTTDGNQGNPGEETTSGTGQQDSNSNNNQNEQTQDETNEGTTSDGGANTNSGDQDDSLPDDDESFFVLPESPVGAAALVMSSLAVLGGFMFLRNRSHSSLPI